MWEVCLECRAPIVTFYTLVYGEGYYILWQTPDTAIPLHLISHLFKNQGQGQSKMLGNDHNSFVYMSSCLSLLFRMVEIVEKVPGCGVIILNRHHS